MSGTRASTWRFTLAGIGLLVLAMVLVVAWSAGSIERALEPFGDDAAGAPAAAPVARGPNAVGWELHRLAAQVAWSANYRYLWHARDARDAPPAPERLHAWLEAHAPAYDAIVALLLGDELPDWGFDPSSRNWSEVPGGAWNLERHLFGRALDQAARGDRAAAERTLLAAWRLEQAMKVGSDAAAWLADFNSSSVIVLRHVRPADAGAWIARLDELSPRQDLEGHLRWAARKTAREAAESQARVPEWLPRGPRAHLVALLDAPARFRTTRSLAALAGLSSTLGRLTPCGDPTRELHAPAASRIGSIFADSQSRPRPPGLDYDFARLRDLEVDIALTRRVLALDAGIEEPTPSPGACGNPPVGQSLGEDGQWTLAWRDDVPSSTAGELGEVIGLIVGGPSGRRRASPSFTFLPRVRPPAAASGGSP